VRSPGIAAIPKYDVFGRLQRLEDSMFTKEDAKEMRAETKAEMKELMFRMNVMFVISTVISLLNPFLGAFNTFFKK